MSASFSRRKARRKPRAVSDCLSRTATSTALAGRVASGFALLSAAGQAADGQPDSAGEPQRRSPALGNDGRDPFRLAAHHNEAVLVGDRPVERQPVQVVLFRRGAHLGHGKFHFEWFLLGGENRAEALRIDAREAPGGDVLTVIGVAADIRVPDPGLAQAFKFVVLADGGEGDLVVDLTDLVQ